MRNALLFLWVLAFVPLPLSATAVGPALSKGGAGLLPESGRGLAPAVVGLDPDNGDYYFLPKLVAPSEALSGWDTVERQVYWLDLELSHGAIFAAISATADLYVGVPGGDGIESRGGERRYFKDYLRERAGWSEAAVVDRVHFFKVPIDMIWAQDAFVMLGDDASGRRRLAQGPEAGDHYKGFLRGLVSAYPGRFVAKALPRGVSGEGGDLAVARRPDGRVGLVIGRHRVLVWLQETGAGDFVGRPVPAALLGQARRAYERAYGLPVLVVPQAPLRQGWGDEDLFHLDMMAGFVSLSQGAGVVVPRLEPGSRDLLSGQPLPEAQASAWRRELDQVAHELAANGYTVSRAPLADHPVRSPSNSVRFAGPSGGPPTVLLPRYPDQSPGPAASLAGLQVQVALAGLRAAGDAWNSAPGAAALPALQAALGRTWASLARAQRLANPVADAQAQAYEALGCHVIPVPDYPWGAGSLHCQFLH